MIRASISGLCVAYWLLSTEPALAGWCAAAWRGLLRVRDLRRYRATDPHVRSAVATVQMVRCRHARRCTAPDNRRLCACQSAYLKEIDHDRTSR